MVARLEWVFAKIAFGLAEHGPYLTSVSFFRRKQATGQVDVVFAFTCCQCSCYPSLLQSTFEIEGSWNWGEVIELSCLVSLFFSFHPFFVLLILFCLSVFSSFVEEFGVAEELSGVEEEDGRASLLWWNTSLEEALITIPSKQWMILTSRKSSRSLWNPWVVSTAGIPFLAG